MVYHKEYEDFLLKLREQGVVHIKENDEKANTPEMQEILQQRKRIDIILKQLQAINSASEKELALAEGKQVALADGFKIVDEIEKLYARKNELQTRIATLDKDMESFSSIWGDFSYELLKKIETAGYIVQFFSCPVAEYNPEWENAYDAIRIQTIQTLCFFITITPKGVVVDVNAEQAKLPTKDLKGLSDEKMQLTKELADCEKRLQEMAVGEYNTLVGLDKQLQNEFNLSHVRTQTASEVENKLMLLEGWVPDEKVETLEQALDQGGYFYRKQAIEENDQVPIELKNNRFVKLYEPICRMFSLPNYREFDPTPFFAPFFMLFFGMCFADAGYGLLMVVVCTIMKKKVNPDYRPYLSLFQYLGSAAFVVGILTGTFFGVELVKVPIFQSVKEYFITSDNLMTISLAIGLFHILFGKSVAALKRMHQKGIKYGIAPFAWVFVITVGVLLFVLPRMNITLSETCTNILYGIAGISLLLALFYNSPGKNIFLNFGTGIWNMYNLASGLIGDTLSYIRLFAIGLTGAILGGVFNSLAISMTEGLSIVPRIIFMTLILLFGHSLNFGLSTISSLVHPLRLIFVEYYKNAEFEGGGEAYNPFKKIN